MTLATHDRTILFLLVTPFTIGVKGFHQGRLPAGCLYFMAFRTSLVLGGFILQQVAVIIIYMGAFVALFDLGQFIVFIMPEY